MITPSVIEEWIDHAIAMDARAAVARERKQHDVAVRAERAHLLVMAAVIARLKRHGSIQPER